MEREVFIKAAEDYGYARSRLVGRLVNPSRCDLSDRPHREWKDLALVYELLNVSFDKEISDKKYIHGYKHVVASDLTLWGVTEDDLYRQAFVNMSIWDPIQINSILEGPIPIIELNANFIKGQMCSIADSLCLCGASNVCYPGVLERLGEQFEEDFYIFPSTEIEMMLMPVSYVEKFHNSVRDILELQTGVSGEWETLSENVYIYRKETGTVEILKLAA